MKKALLINIILLIIITLSCNNKEAKIKDAEILVNDTKENFEKYGQQEWKIADTLIFRLENDMDKNREKYTREQIENANKVIGRYKAIKLKNELNGLKKSMEDVGQQIKGAMEVFADSTKTK